VIPISATDLRKVVRVNVFVSKSSEISGIPDIDLESGISVSIPSRTANLFLDIDVTPLNHFLPDFLGSNGRLAGYHLVSLMSKKEMSALYGSDPLKEEKVNLLDVPENSLILRFLYH